MNWFNTGTTINDDYIQGLHSQLADATISLRKNPRDYESEENIKTITSKIKVYQFHTNKAHGGIENGK